MLLDYLDATHSMSIGIRTGLDVKSLHAKLARQASDHRTDQFCYGFGVLFGPLSVHSGGNPIWSPIKPAMPG
jgi:hypothetical protein